MKTKIRIINGEKYIPISKEKAIMFQNSNIPIYTIDNLKTLFIKVGGVK